MAKNASARDSKQGPRVPIKLISVPGLPEIREGNDLARLIAAAARNARIAFRNGDILVVAQKVVSKAEGRLARLSTIEPSAHASQLASKAGRDPRLVEIILRESRRIVREHPVLIVETHHGFVCANAGVDHSNVLGEDVVTLLPRDPDGSARRIAAELRRLTKKRIAVIISDTFGRPWRLGLTNVAIGAAGVPVLRDLRGTRDRHSKPLQATILASADELAAAAGLLMGKSEGIPAVVIRGYRYRPADERATRIIRPAAEDLFR
jgi:coenzyme F420-0:L-glutamate ligase / coenzyme F420-1:gamma-L-glutamate ligase